MRVQTFTEFVGDLPVFEDDEEDYDLAGYVYGKQDEYYRLHPADPAIKAKVRQFGLEGDMLEKHPDSDLERLETERKLAYDRAYKTLNVYLAREMIELRHIRGNVLDFGFGSGGTSIFLHKHGGNVTAIDKEEDCIAELKETGLFPEEKAVCGNGLAYMNRGPESLFDMIAAFGLGEVNCPMWFIEQFHAASTRAVMPDGRIFVTSDLLTMDKVREVFGVECPPFRADVMVYQPRKPSARQ